MWAANVFACLVSGRGLSTFSPGSIPSLGWNYHRFGGRLGRQHFRRHGCICSLVLSRDTFSHGGGHLFRVLRIRGSSGGSGIVEVCPWNHHDGRQ